MRPTLYIALFLVLNSCISDRPPIDFDVPMQQSESSVLITNEGNFQFGNASISLYDPITQNVSENYFETINGTKLGDVCQSMSFANGSAYIVVNNSGKIVVVDEVSFEWKSDIMGFTSPRNLLQISPAKAYVSELFSNSMKVVSLSKNEIVDEIKIGGESESMVLHYGHVYVTSPNRGMLYKIDVQTDVVEDSLALHINAGSLKLDINNKLWVMCGGNEDLQGKLFRVNPETMGIEVEHRLDKSDFRPTILALNSSLDTLYFIHESVYKMGVSESEIPQTPLIESSDRILYSLAFNPQDKRIYVADAIDYIQKGKIHVYTLNGHEKSSFTAGIIPGQIYFP